MSIGDARVEILEADDATTLSLTATDQDAQDAREAAAFKRALLTPAREDQSPGLTAHPGSEGTTGATMLFTAILLGVFCVVGLSGAPILFALIPVLILIAALRGLVFRRAVPKSPPREARFTITIGPDAVAVANPNSPARSFPLARAMAFEPGRRVELVMTDGSRETMPFTLGTALTRGAAHAELVLALNQHLARRKNARVGYRGAIASREAPVVAEAEEEEALTPSGRPKGSARRR